MNLLGKHVFITGAARRLGRAIAESMVASGANVSAHYFTSSDEVKKLEDFSRRVRAVRANLADVGEIAHAVECATRNFGPVDVLINSASRFESAPALDVTEAQFDGLWAVNLKGQFFMAQACARGMRDRTDLPAGPRGLIVNLADVYATKPLKKYVVYSATKAALRMLTKSLAAEWAPEIRVNSVSPGSVLLPESYGEKARQKIAAKTLLGHVGEPRDIVAAIHFLIENDYVSGFDLVVDGGISYGP